MNTEKQIKALAELDGKTKLLNEASGCAVMYWEDGNDWMMLPKYLTSYDAIIPLLRKQPESVLHKVADAMDIMTTPSQLCEALLRATGKWEE